MAEDLQLARYRQDFLARAYAWRAVFSHEGNIGLDRKAMQLAIALWSVISSKQPSSVQNSVHIVLSYMPFVVGKGSPSEPSFYRDDQIVSHWGWCAGPLPACTKSM